MRGRIPILTYHSLDESNSPISVAPRLFRWQMEYLRAQGWRTLTTDELSNGHARGEWAARTFVLTFDDGFVNFAEHALPVLTQCGFAATLFVVSDWVGRTNDWADQPRWAPRLPLLDWDGIRRAADAGMSLGAHSRSHPRLTRLAARAAEREIAECKTIIAAHSGRSAEIFAYPYGESTRALEETVARYYRLAFSARLGFATRADRITALPRLDAYYLRAPVFFGALEAGWLELYLRLRNWLRETRHRSKRNE